MNPPVFLQILPEGILPAGSASGAGSLAITAVVWLLVIVLVAVISIGLGWWYINNKKFNMTIRIFQKVGGRYEPTKTDKGMFMKVGRAGDTALFLRKHKKWLPVPKQQTGRNTYWFFIREDGEWINFTMGDLDEQSRKLGAHFLDVDMRYARSGLQKNLRDRYDTVNFWQKYGGVVAYTMLILVTGIMVFLLFDKFIEVSSNVSSAVQTAKEVLDQAARILGAVDNIQAGGTSGITPAA